MKQSKGIVLMGVGPGSSKSAIGIGLCRLLADDGIDVSPFKAISIVGGAAHSRRGAAVVHQMAAARQGFVPEMNPVVVQTLDQGERELYLLGDRLGPVRLANEDMVAMHLLPAATLKKVREAVTHAIESLQATHDYLVVEGAASPSDLPASAEISNLLAARVSGYRIVVCCSAPRSGVIGSVIGTVRALPRDLRTQLAAVIVNDVTDQRISTHINRELRACITDVPVYALPHQPNFWSPSGGEPGDQAAYDAFAAGLRQEVLGSGIFG